MVDFGPVVEEVGSFEMSVQLFLLTELVSVEVACPLEVILVVEEAEIRILDIEFGICDAWWHESLDFVCLWQWNTVICSVEYFLSGFGIQSQLIDFCWRQRTSPRLSMIYLLPSCRSVEVTIRTPRRHLQIGSKHLREQLLTTLLPWLSIPINLLTTLIKLGLLILPEHREMLLVLIHLRPIEFALKLLVLIIWVIDLLKDFLLWTQIIPYVFCVKVYSTVAFAFSVES